MNPNQNNSRIAKNTFFLYTRMIIYIIVNLYSSRLILDILGIVDYGIYNLVAGFIISFNLLNFTMIQSTQRFISFEIGKKNIERVKKIFSTSINLQILIALIVFIFVEVFGLWLINNQMNIPEKRIHAAKIVFHLSLIGFIFTTLATPYKSLIISDERMKAFTYISIIETIIKFLFILLLLSFVNYDQLQLYSLFMLISSLLVLLIYFFYCNSYFQECKYEFILDKELNKEMLSFLGWNFLSNSGIMAKSQGSNILLNTFFGPVVNAARGIAFQVEGVVIGFILNFQQAINPQITKLYAAGKKNQMIDLIFNGSKYSFFLITIIFIPLLINTSYILDLWLIEVPEYADLFLQLVLIMSLEKGMIGLFDTAIQATGKIKVVQTYVSLIMFIDIPLCFFVLSLGYPPYFVMYVAIFTEAIAFIYKILYLKKIIGFHMVDLFKKVLFRSIAVFCVCYSISMIISNFVPYNFFGFFVNILSTLIISLFVILYVGLLKSERNFVFTKVKKLIFNK